MHARKYDPSTGRFTAADPIDETTGTPAVANYAYVSNRALIWSDPSGMLHTDAGGSDCSLNPNASDCIAAYSAINDLSPAISAQTGLCESGCGLVRQGVDQYFQRCLAGAGGKIRGIIGLAHLGCAGQRRDDVERQILGEAAKNHIKQDEVEPPFPPLDSRLPCNAELADRLSGHIPDDRFGPGLDDYEIANVLEDILNRATAGDSAIMRTPMIGDDGRFMIYDPKYDVTIVVNTSLIDRSTVLTRNALKFFYKYGGK